MRVSAALSGTSFKSDLSQLEDEGEADLPDHDEKHSDTSPAHSAATSGSYTSEAASASSRHFVTPTQNMESIPTPEDVTSSDEVPNPRWTRPKRRRVRRESAGAAASEAGLTQGAAADPDVALPAHVHKGAGGA